MIDIEKLREILKDRNLKFVAEQVGVHPNVLYRLMDGKTDPRLSTVTAILEYLNKTAVKDV